MDTLTWLHLSDIHFGHGNESRHRVDQKVICEEILKDAQRMVAQLGPPDLVLVTGDIAFHADPVGEYSQAATWLDEKLLPTIGVGKERLYLVPGNHDVDRNKATATFTCRKLHRCLRENPAELDELLDKPAELAQIWSKLEAYAKFAQPYAAPFLTTKQPFWSCERDTVLGRVAIVGLNTNLLSFDVGDSPTNLALGLKQLRDNIQTQPADVLLLVLQHHPPDWLTDGQELRSMLQNRPHLLFCGHVHQQRGLINSPLHGGAHLELVAGAGHADPRLSAEHAYSWGRLSVSGLDYFPRIWNKIQYSFVADQSSFKGMKLSGAVSIACKRLPADLRNWLGSAKVSSRSPGKKKHVKKILYPRPPIFVGRDEDLDEILERLKSPGCVYICGAPGVGKTTLALESVWRLRDYFQDQIIYDFAFNRSFEDILNLIARSFSENTLIGLAFEDKQREVERLLRRHQPVLVYLDNVKGPKWVAQLERLSGSCSLLITSRACATFDWLYDKKLNMLDRDSSIKLFEKAYRQSLSDPDRKHVEEICELLGDMPLAIDICAHHARVAKLQLSSLLGILHTEMLVLLEPVVASINLSYEDLDSRAKRFFAMLSLFWVRTFGIEAVKTTWESEDALEQLFRLINLSLVKPIGDGRYVLHPVIQRFAANKLHESEKHSFFLDRMITYFLEFAESNRADFRQLEVERENILAAMKECDRKSDVGSYLRFADTLLEKYPGYYAYGFLPQKGFWQEAREIVERCLELTDNPESQAKLYEHLGLFHYWKGEHEKAMQAYGEALALYRQYNDYYGKAMILQRQGFIKSDEGFYRDCERLYRESVEIARQHHLSEGMLSTGIHLMGVILYHQCRYEESRQYLEQALEMRKKNESSVAVSVTQRRLAGTYRRLGLLSEAERLLHDCLKVDREAGIERNIARCLRQLGMLQQVQGSLDEARSSFEQSHEVFRRIGNKQGIGSVLTNLGELSIKQGHLEEAKSHLEESFEMAKGLHSPYGMAMNKRWLAEISYQHSDYRLTVEQAMEALHHFESIEHLHVEGVCQLLNKALLGLSLDEMCQLSLLDLFEGQCSKAIKTKFKELWYEARPRLEANDPSIDKHLLDLSHDDRRGYSLIIRLPEEIEQLLSRVCDRLQVVAPNHHYYDSSEYHVTVMTLISATEPMCLDEDLVSRYKKVLSEILSHHRPFRIHFRGISASKDSVMALGFFKDDSLDQIRRAIREQAVALGFPGEIKERYPNISAHATFVRFRSQENVKELVQEIDRLESCELGVCPVGELKLVMNDWYMSKDKVTTLASFKLK